MLSWTISHTATKYNQGMISCVQGSMGLFIKCVWHLSATERATLSNILELDMCGLLILSKDSTESVTKKIIKTGEI